MGRRKWRTHPSQSRILDRPFDCTGARLWRHFFGHRACDNHQVRLTRRWAENLAAKTRDIIPRRRCRDHLYRATSESELERPNRVFAPPVVKLLHRSHPDPLLLQFATQAFVDSFAHFSTLTP